MIDVDSLSFPQKIVFEPSQRKSVWNFDQPEDLFATFFWLNNKNMHWKNHFAINLNLRLGCLVEM